MDGSLVLFCYGLRVQFTTIVCFECVRSGFVLKTEAFIHRFLWARRKVDVCPI